MCVVWSLGLGCVLFPLAAFGFVVVVVTVGVGVGAGVAVGVGLLPVVARFVIDRVVLLSACSGGLGFGAAVVAAPVPGCLVAAVVVVSGAASVVLALLFGLPRPLALPLPWARPRPLVSVVDVVPLVLSARVSAAFVVVELSVALPLSCLSLVLAVLVLPIGCH